MKSIALATVALLSISSSFTNGAVLRTSTFDSGLRPEEGWDCTVDHDCQHTGDPSAYCYYGKCYCVQDKAAAIAQGTFNDDSWQSSRWCGQLNQSQEYLHTFLFTAEWENRSKQFTCRQFRENSDSLEVFEEGLKKANSFTYVDAESMCVNNWTTAYITTLRSVNIDQANKEATEILKSIRPSLADEGQIYTVKTADIDARVALGPDQKCYLDNSLKTITLRGVCYPLECMDGYWRREVAPYGLRNDTNWDCYTSHGWLSNVAIAGTVAGGVLCCGLCAAAVWAAICLSKNRNEKENQEPFYDDDEFAEPEEPMNNKYEGDANIPDDEEPQSEAVPFNL